MKENVFINKVWDSLLKEEMDKEYYKQLSEFVKNEYKTKICYPQYKDIFNALKYTDYDKVKVVILGQDPYHGENEADGYAFSSQGDVKRPKSLNNIFKELKNDMGIIKKTNSLVDWAKQGVLLLNCIMTVEKNSPLSHKGKGWEIFTDCIIKLLNEKEEPVVFILWGNYARSKKNLITNKKHYILESSHPSPYSVNKGFYGSKPFSKTNKILKKNNIKPINW